MSVQATLASAQIRLPSGESQIAAASGFRGDALFGSAKAS